MLPRVTLISCAALVLFTANTINAAPLNQKRFFGDGEDINEALDGYDFGPGGFGDFTGVTFGNNEGLSVDGADTQLSEVFTKRDGDNILHAGGGIRLPGDDFAKRDGDNILHAGGGIRLPGDDFAKRDGDNILHAGGGIRLPGDDFVKRDGDNILHAGGGIRLPGDDFTKRSLPDDV